MSTFRIHSGNSNQEYVKKFTDEDVARNWVINHLDLSLNWVITKIGK